MPAVKRLAVPSEYVRDVPAAAPDIGHYASYLDQRGWSTKKPAAQATGLQAVGESSERGDWKSMTGETAACPELLCGL